MAVLASVLFAVAGRWDLPLVWAYLGVGLLGLAVVLGRKPGVTPDVWMWAMVVNRFFSSEVRIQRERGHRVIGDGPYRFVRHPGYAAVIVFFLATPLALGSWWASLPMAPVVLLFVRRTVLEDRLLCAELAGYEFYV